MCLEQTGFRSLNHVSFLLVRVCTSDNFQIFNGQTDFASHCSQEPNPVNVENERIAAAYNSRIKT